MKKSLYYIFPIILCILLFTTSAYTFVQKEDSNYEILNSPKLKQNKFLLPLPYYIPNIIWEDIVPKLDGPSARNFYLVSKFTQELVKKRRIIKFKTDTPSNIFYEYLKNQKPTYIDISGCKGILLNDFYKAVSFCNELKYLNISYYEDIMGFSIFQLSNNWSKLEVIKFDYCYNITPGEFRKYLKAYSLPSTTINVFKEAFKKQKINLRRANSNLSTLIWRD